MLRALWRHNYSMAISRQEISRQIFFGLTKCNLQTECRRSNNMNAKLTVIAIIWSNQGKLCIKWSFYRVSTKKDAEKNWPFLAKKPLRMHGTRYTPGCSPIPLKMLASPSKNFRTPQSPQFLGKITYGYLCMKLVQNNMQKSKHRKNYLFLEQSWLHEHSFVVIWTLFKYNDFLCCWCYWWCSDDIF